MAIVKKIDLTDALEKSLSKYYAKLILDRAFPDVRDGLKPVQRRILYVMDRDGVSSNKRFVKSMRVTGNVSSIHWDLVAIGRSEYGGSEIYFDDELIRKDGYFVKEELKDLNK